MIATFAFFVVVVVIATEIDLFPLPFGFRICAGSDYMQTSSKLCVMLIIRCRVIFFLVVDFFVLRLHSHIQY